MEEEQAVQSMQTRSSTGNRARHSVSNPVDWHAEELTKQAATVSQMFRNGPAGGEVELEGGACGTRGTEASGIAVSVRPG
jgi:hypothetical protein